MRQKKYKTEHGNLSISLLVKGKSRRIRFISSDGRTGYFSTADPLLQAAIAGYSGFGEKVQEIQNESTEEQPQPLLSPIERITTWQEARDFLHQKPYGIAIKRLSSPQLIEEEAAVKGICFPLLKRDTSKQII